METSTHTPTPRTTRGRFLLALSVALAALSAGTFAVAQQAGGPPPRLDQNDDGLVSEDEFVAGGARHLARIDRDGDGEVSAEELEAMRQHIEQRVDERFEELDQNDDGAISRDELAAMREQRHGQRQERIEDADLNQDGALSADELEEAARERFAAIDQDGDGVLTEDELRQGMPHGGPGGHGPGRPGGDCAGPRGDR